MSQTRSQTEACAAGIEVNFEVKMGDIHQSLVNGSEAFEDAKQELALELSDTGRHVTDRQ